MVLKQSFDNGEEVNTYYVYNDLGQLSYVLPPIAADSLPNEPGQINDDNGVLIRYAYLYKYDERGNCIEKRLPGCDSIIYMVYDKADRLILSQDGNQRQKHQWTVNKYDVLGRLLYTGYLTSTGSMRQQYMTKFRDLIVTESYTGSKVFAETGYTCNTNYFTETISPLIVNYYDNHNFVTDLGLTNLTDIQKPNYDTKYDNHKGLLTGISTYLLDGSGDYITSVMYYDYKGQVVQSRSTNHLGGYDLVYNKYNFTGNLIKTLKEHSISGLSTVAELYDYTYDHALRPATTTYTLNNKPPVVLASNKYDEFGRLKEKKRHSNADTEEFEYNLRGWTTKIKSGTTFEENLFYNTSSFPCYNGNISRSTWKYNGTTHGYYYYYDTMNRLVGADQNTNTNYAEYFTYNKQGNITILERYGESFEIDNMELNYYGNQLQRVYDDEGSRNLYNTKEYTDRSNEEIEFIYDANGNMITDLDRDIVTIKYNLLNLPYLIQFKNGCQIKNTYSADGQKLSSRYVTVAEGIYQPLNPGQVIENLDVNENDNVTVDGTDYVGNIEYQVYRYFNWDVTFEPAELKYLWRVHNPEGYVSTFGINSSYGPAYNYYRKDHLGNNREVWNASYKWGSATRPAATNQITQYYPSGLPWKSNTGDNPGSQPYKYGGKEFVEMHGLDEYDSEARWYYPAIMRTTTMDPLAEKYYDVSPYAWCGNNPVNRIDPDGMDWFFHSADGKADPTWIWHDGSTYNSEVKDSNGKDVILQGQEAVVVFDGSKDEKLGEDGTLTGKGSKSAKVTIYGIGGKDDIRTYDGLTVSSDPSKYSMVASGDYNLSWEQMATSPYGKGSLTYRVRQLDGNAELPIEGGGKNKATGKSYLGSIFFHRTNWNGGAKYSSQGCLIIDGRQWRNVEKQLDKSKDILLQIKRK